MADNETPLSEDERAELERLRAAQAEAAAANQARIEREELKRLREKQKYAREDAAYYAEKARRKAEREKERENPDFSVDDLPPMPKKQKIVLGAVGVAVLALVGYLVWFNMAGGSEVMKVAPVGGGEAAASASLEADAA